MKMPPLTSPCPLGMLRLLPTVVERRLASYQAGCGVKTRLHGSNTELTWAPPTLRMTSTSAVPAGLANQPLVSESLAQYATPRLTKQSVVLPVLLPAPDRVIV